MEKRHRHHHLIRRRRHHLVKLVLVKVEEERVVLVRLDHQAHLVMLDQTERMVIMVKMVMLVHLVIQRLLELNHRRPIAQILACQQVPRVHLVRQVQKETRVRLETHHHLHHLESKDNPARLDPLVQQAQLARTKIKDPKATMAKLSNNRVYLDPQDHQVQLVHQVPLVQKAKMANQATHQHPVHQAIKVHQVLLAKMSNQVPKVPMDRLVRKVHAVTVHQPERHLVSNNRISNCSSILYLFVAYSFIAKQFQMVVG